MSVIGYNPLGTIVALVLASFGAYTALALARRARAGDGPIRLGWLASGAVTLGLAIWSMHVIAIVSTTFTTPVSLDLRQMVLPLAVAVPVIAIALLPLCTVERPGSARVIFAGVVMGLGVCVLHYLGAAALSFVEPSYDPLRVAASAFLAAGACTLMLLLSVRHRGQAAQVASAVGLGLGIAATHVVGMSAACFHARPAFVAADDFPVRWVATGIVAATVILFLFALLATLFDRRIAELTARETELLRRSEQRLRSILEQLPLGIALAGPATRRPSVVNRRAHDLLGDDLDPTLLEAAVSADKPAGPIVTTDRQKRGPVGGHIVEYTDLAGRPGSLEVWSTPILGANGGAGQIVYAFQDITSRLSAEAELRQAHKMEAVGQLTGGIAHDFNNLLTAALGSLDLLALQVQGEPARTLLRHAIEATERGARLTSQLLGFSRRQSLRPEIVHVNAVVDGMTELLGSTLGGTVQVQTAPFPALWTALADRTQLELVILNLAINARDAMPLGGTILIRTENVRSGHPTAAADPPAGEHVLLSVSDNGTGMSAETLARVFEPFFTTKPPGKGSGLGLSQVLGIAQQLGGGVRIRSEEGLGTTVQLFVPRGIAIETEATPDPVVDAEPLSLEARRILLVDDDDDVRVAACSTLTRLGCTVIEACCGRDAIDLAARHGDALDAVIMDYAMPEMTGVEAAERIRAARPDLPILLVTGYADPDWLSDAAKRYPILAKPFRSAQLAARLGTLFALPEPDAKRVVRFPSPPDHPRRRAATP